MHNRLRTSLMLIGPLLALLVGSIAFGSGLSFAASVTLGVTMLCLVWWISEAVPIPVASLAPLALLPMFEVLPMNEVSAAYGDKLVLLLLGGFILSTAMSSSGAHRRVALNMVRLFGGSSSRRLVFGFMAATAVLSMWISNTATVLMMLPVAIAVIDASSDRNLTKPLLLGIAYAASIGGIGTPIGTPPNVVFSGVYSQVVGEEIGFAQWMTWGVPVVLLFLPIAGIWLTRHLSYQGSVPLPEIGEASSHEKRVLMVFGLTALAWITRQAPFGGWEAMLNVPVTNDAMVALLAVIAMFLIPNGQGGRLLDWESANKIPWGMLLLFGAGIAIAKAFVASGLSGTLGEYLSLLSTWPVLLMIATICLVVTFLTEATSNTATTTLLMPILAAAAIGAAIDPRLLMIPAAMSASCAFMLPVATPPNLIAFSTERFSLEAMAREGLVLNLIGVAVISTMCYLILA